MIPTAYRLRLAGVALSALMFGSALWSSSAAACKCKLPTVEEAKEGSTAIFEGRVTKVEDEPAVKDGPPPGKLITFALVRTWKALEDQEVITLRTNESSASCGYTFELSTSYLVYAGGELGALSASACSRTRAMSEASEDTSALGAGITPVKVEAKPDAGTKEPPKTKGGGCATTHSSSVSASTSSSVPPLPLFLFGAPVVAGVAARRGRRRRG
jgi:hypothetical protein